MNTRPLLPALVLAALALAAPASAQVVFVDASATGANDGSSWTDAFTDLQSALESAIVGTQIWVANGTYTPSVEANPGDPRSATFTLGNALTLLGGFAGGETSASQRDPDANPTNLSGDIGAPGVASDNAYHVLRGSIIVLPTTVDGITIRAGNASGGALDNRGGGMTLDGAVVTLRDVRFLNNRALGAGGGLFAEDSSVTIEDCTFDSNTVDELENTLAGGGLCVRNGTATIRDSVFVDNFSNGFSFGAGMALVGGEHLVEGCLFTGNEADRAAAANLISLTNPVIRDCEFIENVGRIGGTVSVPFVTGTGLFEDCTFVGNRQANGGSGLIGGSSSSLIYRRCRFETGEVPDADARVLVNFSGGAPTRIESCDFIGNPALGTASGLSITESSPTVTNCRFVGNADTFNGGAVSITDQGTPFGTASEPLFTNCVFTGNRGTNGGAVYMDAASRPKFANCTFTNNVATAEGGAFHVAQLFVDIPEPKIKNCVLWGNSDASGSDESAQVHVVGAPIVDIDYSLIQGWTGGLGGNGVIDADPLFVDADGPDDVVGTLDDDLRLGAGSPAIDAGNAAVLDQDVSDLDCDGDVAEDVPLDLAGVLRRADDVDVPNTGAGGQPFIDMGAFERGAWSNLGFALAGTNGEPCLVGEGTLVAGTPTNHFLTNALPDTVATLFIGFARLDAPFKGGTLVPTPNLIIAGLPTGPNGTSQIPATFPAGAPPGVSFYMQYWITDAGAPKGLSASNAVAGTTP